MYTLAVENTVKVPVKFNLNNAGKVSNFSYSLTCDRLEQDELRDVFADKDLTIKDLLKRITKGWNGQTLVLDDSNKPAEFSEDAFNAMLRVAGIDSVIYSAYLKEVGAKEKN